MERKRLKLSARESRLAARVRALETYLAEAQRDAKESSDRVHSLQDAIIERDDRIARLVKAKEAGDTRIVELARALDANEKELRYLRTIAKLAERFT